MSPAFEHALQIQSAAFLQLLFHGCQRTYTDEPPIPSKVLGPGGQLLSYGQDVVAIGEYPEKLKAEQADDRHRLYPAF